MSYQDFGKILIQAVLYEIHLRICKGQNVTVIKVDFPIFLSVFRTLKKKITERKKKKKKEKERNVCIFSTFLYFYYKSKLQFSI